VEAPVIALGLLLTNVAEFVIVAFYVFLMEKVINILIRNPQFAQSPLLTVFPTPTGGLV